MWYLLECKNQGLAIRKMMTSALKAMMLLGFIYNAYGHANTVYGVENLTKLRQFTQEPTYVQMGSFTKARAAENYQERLRAITTAPVVIRFSSNKYQVMVGPFNNDTALRAFAKNYYKQHPGQSIQTSQDMPSWFINAQAGGQQMNFRSSTTVNNGLGLPSPYSQDIYTVNSPEMTGLLGFQAGHRWSLSSEWLSAFSLGAKYQYFLASHVNGEVIQYSLPQFTNYTYQWQAASNLILANAKLNFVNYRGFSPYVNAGVGAVFNINEVYSEMPLAGVTPRLSPDYGANAGAQCAYILGVGLDYQLTRQFILSAEYQYSHLGNLSSGSGSDAWSSQSLNFGLNQSNAFLFGLTYLFDISLNFPSLK